MAQSEYQKNVFINCPFDSEFDSIFRALVFTVFDCGYSPRCALESGDSSQVRINKISRIIAESKYSIHDISRTQPDAKTGLPRFNMPLELGMFLGAKWYGDEHQQKKVCLIFDSEPYRYQCFISDIAGQDIRYHNNDLKDAIKKTRDWLSESSGSTPIHGGAEIHRRFQRFCQEMGPMCNEMHWDSHDLTFNDYIYLISIWSKNNCVQKNVVKKEDTTGNYAHKSIADVEQRLILRTLAECQGNKKQAAEILGISLKTLFNRLNYYDMINYSSKGA